MATALGYVMIGAGLLLIYAAYTDQAPRDVLTRNLAKGGGAPR